MGKKIIRAGIVGSGLRVFITLHYKIYLGSKIELLGVCAVAKAELQEYAQSRNLTAYDKLDALKDCDLIHVCTPPITH